MGNYITQVYSEPIKHLRRSFFAKIIISLKLSGIFAKSSILDFGLVSKYGFAADITWKNVFQIRDFAEITKAHYLPTFEMDQRHLFLLLYVVYRIIITRPKVIFRTLSKIYEGVFLV